MAEIDAQICWTLPLGSRGCSCLQPFNIFLLYSSQCVVMHFCWSIWFRFWICVSPCHWLALQSDVASLQLSQLNVQQLQLVIRNKVDSMLASNQACRWKTHPTIIQTIAEADPTLRYLEGGGHRSWLTWLPAWLGDFGSVPGPNQQARGVTAECQERFGPRHQTRMD